MGGLCAKSASWHALFRSGVSGLVRLHQRPCTCCLYLKLSRRNSLTPFSSHQFTNLLKLFGSLVVPPCVSESVSPGAHLTRLRIHRADPLSTLSVCVWTSPPHIIAGAGLRPFTSPPIRPPPQKSSENRIYSLSMYVGIFSSARFSTHPCNLNDKGQSLLFCHSF